MLILTISAPSMYLTIKQWAEHGVEPPPDQLIEVGTKVEYLGHIVGGMVKVRHNGEKVIIHPSGTVELSQ